MSTGTKYRRRPSIEEVRKHFRTTPLNSRERSARELIFVDVIFDVSGSMSEYYDELVWCFNNILLHGLLKASRKNVAAVRLGCLLFSNKIILPWVGFKSLDEVLADPLNISHLQQDGLRDQTALYKAIIKGVRGTTLNAQIAMDNHSISMPLRKIMILTDGANNLEPSDPSEVLREIQAANFSTNKEQDLVTLAYFKTGQGLSESEFGKIAKQIGISNYYSADLTSKGPGDLEVRSQHFRHHFNVLSSLEELS